MDPVNSEGGLFPDLFPEQRQRPQALIQGGDFFGAAGCPPPLRSEAAAASPQPLLRYPPDIAKNP